MCPCCQFVAILAFSPVTWGVKILFYVFPLLCFDYVFYSILNKVMWIITNNLITHQNWQKLYHVAKQLGQIAECFVPLIYVIIHSFANSFIHLPIYLFCCCWVPSDTATLKKGTLLEVSLLEVSLLLGRLCAKTNLDLSIHLSALIILLFLWVPSDTATLTFGCSLIYVLV